MITNIFQLLNNATTKRLTLGYLFIPAFLILAIGSACSPVRTGNPKPVVEEEKETLYLDSEDDEYNKNDSSIDRRELEGILGSGTNSIESDSKDTLVVRLSPLISKYDEATDTKAVDQQLSDISDMLDSGMADEACTLSSSLYESLGDSEQKYHARFYMGECLVAKNDLNSAKVIFEEIINGNSKLEAREKSLIRLGQIMCLEKRTDEATKYFVMLRTEFPKSIYLPLAKC